MSRDAGVAEERHLAELTGDVRATNADAMNPNERLTWPGLIRLGNFNATKTLRLFELDGFQRYQLFRVNPSACPTFFTGLKISRTSANNCWSSGSSIHFAHLRMFSGFALPAMVVVMSGLAHEN